MADAQRELKIVINTDSAQAENKLSGFGGTLKRVGEIAGGFIAAQVVTKGFQLLTESVTGSIKAFEESQAVLAQTNAVLASTHNAAGMTAQAVSDLASELQDASAFSDEEIQSGENLLLTFTKIGKDVFPQATQAIVDMSQALGQDMKSSAIQLGKALNDPIQGVTALRRVGVSFSKDQIEVIKQLEATGQHVKAQQLILKELNTEFGGSASKAALTYAGSMKILKNQLNDIQEAFGGLLVQGLMKITEPMSLAIDAFRQFFIFGNKAADSVVEFKNRFPGVIQAVNALVTAFKFLQSHWEMVRAGLIGVGTAILVALIPALVTLVTVSIPAAIVGFGALIVAMAPFIAIAAAVGVAVYVLKKAWDTNFMGIKDLILSLPKHFHDFLKAVQDVFEKCTKAVKDFVDNTKKFFADIPKNFSNAIKGLEKSYSDMVDQNKKAHAAMDAQTKKFWLNDFPQTLGTAVGSVKKNLPIIINEIEKTMSQMPAKTTKWFEQTRALSVAKTNQMGTDLKTGYEKMVIDMTVSLINLYNQTSIWFENTRIAIINKITSTWAWLGAEVSQWPARFVNFLNHLPGDIEKILNELHGVWKKTTSAIWSTISGWGKQIQGLFKDITDSINGAISAFEKAFAKGVAIGTGQKRATGGFASGLTLVGERGPELVNLPNGSYVNNAPATARMGGQGGGVTININNPTVRSDQDIQAIADAVRRAMGRQAELARMNLI